MPFLKRLISGLFNITIGPVLALILIFEEWGWEPLARLLGYLARLPLWARMEALIARLPPYGALMVFFAPMVLLLPVKVLALYWISRGHQLLGLALIVVAKLVGTAAVARLFALTQPALMRMPWFAHLYGHWKQWKDALITRVKSTALWQQVAKTVRAIRHHIGF